MRNRVRSENWVVDKTQTSNKVTTAFFKDGPGFLYVHNPYTVASGVEFSMEITTPRGFFSATVAPAQTLRFPIMEGEVAITGPVYPAVPPQLRNIPYGFSEV